MKPSIVLILAAAAAWAQSPAPKLTCDGPAPVNGNLFPYCEMRETEAPFNGSVAITTGGSGDVTVQSWDGPDILVRAQVRTFAATTSLAAVVATMVTLDTADGNVTGGGPASHTSQSWSLSLEIYVPHKLGLSATTLNGSVSVQDVEGQPGVVLATLNGNVSVSGIVGPVRLATTNGGISAAGVAGPIQFSGINGKVSLTRTAGDVEGSLVNGAMFVAADRWVGQTWNVQTINGSIELEVPSNCSAHADLSTQLGTIATNLPAPDPKRIGLGRILSFDIGAGGPLIRASLVVGSIQLKQVD